MDTAEQTKNDAGIETVTIPETEATKDNDTDTAVLQAAEGVNEIVIGDSSNVGSEAEATASAEAPSTDGGPAGDQTESATAVAVAGVQVEIEPASNDAAAADVGEEEGIDNDRAVLQTLYET